LLIIQAVEFTERCLSHETRAMQNAIETNDKTSDVHCIIYSTELMGMFTPRYESLKSNLESK